VHFIPLLDCTTAIFGGLKHFGGQTLTHGLLRTLAGRLTQPAHSQRGAASRTHFNRYLIVGTTNTAGFHFNHRLDITHGRTEHFQRILAGLGRNDIESAIDNALGNRLLAALHDGVDELGDFDIAELRIRQNVALGYFTTTGHINLY
jgi:hypothetical protein